MRLTDYDWGVLSMLLILGLTALFGTVFTAGTFLGYAIIYTAIALIVNAIWKQKK